MATKVKAELPKGFTGIDKFNGKFKPNGTQFEFSKPVKLNSESKGVVDGQVYRYALSPGQLYYTSLDGQYLDDVNGFSFEKESEEEVSQ